MTTASNAFISAATTPIMLLGTFHFQDRGLDAYKPKFDVEILSPQRQQEVAEVVERLATLGSLPSPNSPAEFDAIIKSDERVYAELLQKAGLQAK